MCGQRCYLLKALRWQGLSSRLINTVFQSLILSRLAYALPSWGGFMSKLQINKIDAFLAKAHRFGYTLTSTTICDMLHDSDKVLFRSVKNVNHCINSLLPPVRDVSMDLMAWSQRPTRLNSTQLRMTENRSVFASRGSSEHFRTSWVELSRIGRCDHSKNSDKLVVTQFLAIGQ